MCFNLECVCTDKINCLQTAASLWSHPNKHIIYNKPCIPKGHGPGHTSIYTAFVHYNTIFPIEWLQCSAEIGFDMIHVMLLSISIQKLMWTALIFCCCWERRMHIWILNMTLIGNGFGIFSGICLLWPIHLLWVLCHINSCWKIAHCHATDSLRT